MINEKAEDISDEAAEAELYKIELDVIFNETVYINDQDINSNIAKFKA